MRVKISYGVELDQIPEEVQKLFDSVMQWQDTLSRQADTIDDLLEAEELRACLSVMEKMRETLGKLDSRLADLSQIVDGYDTYMKQIGAENELSTSEGRPIVDPPSSNVVSGTEQSDGSEIE